MDTRQRNLLIRNAIGGAVLLVLAILAMAWLGVFEGEQSDDARVRRLMQAIQSEINDHDWDDFFLMCDLTAEETEQWRAAVPAQAAMVRIDTMQPKGLISVPRGATEYAFDVHVIAHLEVPIAGTLRADTLDGTLYMVKIGETWKLDLKRSATTFPYIPAPRPARR